MDTSSPDLKVLTAPQMYNMDLLNGGHLGNQPAFPGQAYSAGNKITLEQVDPSTFEEDSDDDEFGTGKGLRPGKKTKGRVKIKMEFIENKLRRYTTFSKRKTGIMKKAYELSTLTGTQVMLLVASETGHVYTFATRKLQPMITSESGKALIQTCLNSPDPPPIAPGQQQAVEQRMNPGGFEETELTYAVEEENGKPMVMDSTGGLKPVYTMNSSPTVQENYSHSQATQPVVQQTQLQPSTQTYQPASTVPMATVVQQPHYQTSTSPQPSTTKSSTPGSISVHLPGLPPGFILQPGQSFVIPGQQGSQVATSQQAQQQQIYRISTPTQGTQVLQTENGQRIQSNGTSTSAATTVNVLNTGTHQAASALTPSVFMYQTPQGIVYAPATGPIQDKTIFNFQQPATALSDTGQQAGQVQQQSQQGQQQIITIPMPVSLAGSQQVLQLTTTESTQLSDLSQPSAAKKSRKT
ncbi:serum response factor-like [Mercenaria mercenaria]|uniref:serum response factor-like n=1 Tax=Mercenaria mercenaria TaxID=6596 RepID=UPI00234E8BF9|nr:serum response factor-like [Mercenaria mercenaria]